MGCLLCPACCASPDKSGSRCTTRSSRGQWQASAATSNASKNAWASSSADILGRLIFGGFSLAFPHPLPAAATPASGDLPAPSVAPAVRRALLPDAPAQPPSPPGLSPGLPRGLGDLAPCLLFSFFFRTGTVTPSYGFYPRAGHHCSDLPATRRNEEETAVGVHDSVFLFFLYSHGTEHTSVRSGDRSLFCPGSPF